MGNDPSKPKFINTHHSTNNNSNQHPRSRRTRGISADRINSHAVDNTSNNDHHQNQQHQHLHAQQAPAVAEPIDRRAHYRNQDKRFAKLVREERNAYVSPPLEINANNNTNTRNNNSKTSSTTNNNNRLGPLPPTEVPSGISGQPKSTLWPDPWVALMVRCAAIAPFSEGQEVDPLSTSDFVSFMLQTITEPNTVTNSKMLEGKNGHIPDSSSGAAVASSSPSSSLPTQGDKKANSRNNNGENDFSNNDDQRQTSTSESDWLVIDTAESRVPFISSSQPWPMEECCICLNLYDTGLNHCGRCHQAVCSECLLHLVKPVKIDASNDANIKAAINKKRRCMMRVEKLIKEEELKMAQELKRLEITKKRIEREQEQQQAKNNNGGNDENQVDGCLLDANSNGNHPLSKSFASTIHNFAKLGASAVSNTFNDVVHTISTTIKEHNNSSLNRQILLLQQQDTNEYRELQQAKRILELLRRTEVTGLFSRPKKLNPTSSSNNRTGSRRNSNINNNDQQQATTLIHEDEIMEYDDADIENTFLRNLDSSSPTSSEDSDFETNMSSAVSSVANYNNNTSNNGNDSFDCGNNNSSPSHQQQRQNQNQQMTTRLQRRQNLILYGKHHWATPVSFDFDDCSDKEPSLIEKVRLLVQKAIRVESRGRCPMCQAFPAVWYFSGRKLRTRMLYELMAEHGADPRILGLFSEISAAEEEERKRRDKLLANNNFGVPTKADSVWIKPTQEEALEYELCIALALSSVMSAVVDAGVGRTSSPSPRSADKNSPLKNSHQNNMNEKTPNGNDDDDDQEDVLEKTEKILNENSEMWAQLCKNCGSPNWKEYRCRVCRAPRM